MARVADALRRRTSFLDGAAKRMLIDGLWVEAASGETFTSTNPSTGEQVAAIALGDVEDLNRAVAAARRAFDGPWSKVKPLERQRLLLRLADLLDQHYEELQFITAVDMGMPLSISARMRGGAGDRTRFYAGAALLTHGETVENSIMGDVVSYTLREPAGVVGGIIPWNAPLGFSLLKICPALATGCTIVLKPSIEASLTALHIGELVMEAGVPNGVVNVVTGSGDTVGRALAAHPDVDKVAMTGSTAAGQDVVRASAGNMKRVTLELGGKSPNIVFADADIEVAVQKSVMAAFMMTGQVCMAGSRLFVERPIYERFLEAIVHGAKLLKVGDSLDPATVLGPLVSARQLERVIGYIERGQAEGAKLATGGNRLTDGELARGCFVAPTVFYDVRDDMRIAREEIFGPVLSVMPFDDIDEVIRRANDTTYGLAGGVWTRDVSKAMRVSRAIRAGMVWVNGWMDNDSALPGGGYKMSGYGRELGMEHLNAFLNIKSVTIRVS